VFVLLVLCGGLAAQRTWIVDRQNRPGTDFTDIQPALDAAAANDVVLIRYVDNAVNGLYYEAGSVAGKGLVITGDDPVLRAPVLGQFVISNVPGGQAMVISNLANGDRYYDNPTASRWLPYRGVQATNCQGPVHLVNLRIGCPPNQPCASVGWIGAPLALQPNPCAFDTCDLVTVSNSIIWQGRSGGCMRVDRTRLVVSSSFIGGGPAAQLFQWYATITLLATNNEAWFTDCTIVGSDGWSYLPMGLYTTATPAIMVCSTRLHFAGTCVLSGGSDVLGGHLSVASEFSPLCNVGGPYTVIDADPRTSFATGLGPRITVRWAPTAGMTWTLDPTAQSLTTRQYGYPNSPMLWAMSQVRSLPVVFPFGQFFLEPQFISVLALVAGNPTGQHDLVLPLVQLPAVGVSVGLQGVQLTPAGQVQLSNVVAPGRY
jgi:hypothetical protein